MAACCYTGVDLRNQFDHNFLSGSRYGTPHASSELLSSSLLVPLIWTNYFKSNFAFSLLLGQKYSELNFPFSLSLFRQNKEVRIFFSLCFSWTKNYKSNFDSPQVLWNFFFFHLSHKFTSILPRNSKTISFSFLAVNSLQSCITTLKQLPFFLLVANSPFEIIVSQIYKRRVPETKHRSPVSVNSVRQSKFLLVQKQYISLVNSETFCINPDVIYRWFPNENSQWIEPYKFAALLIIFLWIHELRKFLARP